MQLNLWKGLVALAVITPALWLAGHAPLEMPSQLTALLLLSGALGIGLGDTAFFNALNRLGERNTVLVAETTAPLLALLGAGLWLGEWPGPLKLLGMAAVLGGVALVLVQPGEKNSATGRVLKAGLGWALLAALCQAGGAVITRLAFLRADVAASDSAWLRLLGGALLLSLLLPLRHQRYLPTRVSPRLMLAVALAALIGTVGGIIFQQLAFKHTQAAVAQTSLAMSVLFVLVLNTLGGKPSTGRVWLGVLLSVAGVGLLYAG
ncbi:MAG: EamA family transporter [Candidatus Cloacimonetes bacterium]|nr:EamA family transporter [Candidatus Cloacimonadota bacterium]